MRLGQSVPFFNSRALSVVAGVLVLGVTVVAFSSAASATPEIQSGLVSKCIDDLHSSTSNGNEVDSYSCNGTGAQQWVREPDGAISAEGKCLDVYRQKTGNGAKVDLYSCNGGINQKWTYNGRDELVSAQSGKCLDIPKASTVNGTQLQIWKCIGDIQQTWHFTTYEPAQTATPTPKPVQNPTLTPTPAPTTAPTQNPTPATTPTPAPVSSDTGAKYAPPAGKAYLGWSGPVGNEAIFDKAAGISSHPAIYNGYTAADGDMNPIINMASSTDEAPMISWNVTMSGDAITNGSEDTYLKNQAAEAKAYGKAIFIRLNWEMNGTWYSNYDTSTTTPAEYVASWQHIYNIFKADAPNAAFVWCPNVGDPTGQAADTWYPGDAYVDWIALDAYPDFTNPATTVLTQGDGMDDFATFSAAHGKPLMLAEWAVGELNGGVAPDNSSVMDIVFGWANKYPNTVGALIYFDNNTQGTDFTLEDHPNAAIAFRSYTGSGSRYIDVLNQ